MQYLICVSNMHGSTSDVHNAVTVVSFKFCAVFLWQIYQRLSEEASNGVEETQDRCITFLRKFRAYLLKICNANTDDIDKASSMSCRFKHIQPSRMTSPITH